MKLLFLREISASQIDFFRMLDEKIENVRDSPTLHAVSLLYYRTTCNAVCL